MTISPPRVAGLLAVGVLVASGCAVGNRHRYQDVVVPLPELAGPGRVAVGVHDRRPYVISGGKSPNFVGLQRGGYANPFNVTTASGRPLADEMTDAIVRSLAARGFEASGIYLSFEDDGPSVVRRFRTAQTDRGLLLTLREWKADSMVNTELYYDVSLQILDGEGRVIAEKALTGSDNLGGSVWNAPAHARNAVPPAFGRKLGELLGDRALIAALAATTRPEVAPSMAP